MLRTFYILIILVSMSGLAEPSDYETIQASKIEFNDKALAYKVAISFHHAILETDYEAGYIIANLTAEEKNTLKSHGLTVTPATEWQQKYQTFQKKLAEQIKSHSKSSMAGIPGFSCYATVEETFQQAANLKTAYPQLAEWVDIGDSWKKTNGLGGYDLMVLKITNKDIAGDKPKLFINTGLHAREYAPVQLALDFAHKLLEEYATNADIQWIVDHHEVHFLLQSNPDGRKIAEQGIYQRKNTNSNHCPEDTVGVDLNRNFAHFWNVTANGSSGESCSEVYRGVSAESEPETQALSNYARAIFADSRGPGDQDAAPDSTTGIHLDIHSYSQLVLWPYGHTNQVSPNNTGFVALGNKFAWYNNYQPQQSIGLYATDGTSDDVSYGELGVAAFTFELGTSFFQSCSNYQNTIKPGNTNALIFAAKTAAAPYLLALGPEISKIDLNGSLGTASVSAGTPVEISATATLSQTKRSISGRYISRVEYSIDTPVWLAEATPIELTINDGNLSSATEILQGSIATDNLSIGQHTLYVRGYENNNRVGVTTARFINISERVNSLPTAVISNQCNYLECNFDGATSSDSDGSIQAYAWLVTEDNTSTSFEGPTAAFTFASAGNKLVTLTVTDNEGAQVNTTLELSVTAAPVAPVEPEPAASSGGGTLIWLNGFLMLVIFTRRKLIL